MKKRYLITATDKEHVKSLVSDYCKDGFHISYCDKGSIQLENNTEVVKIEY